MGKRKNIDIKRIIKLIKEGSTLEQTAQQEGVCIATLRKRINESKGTKEYEEYKKIIKTVKRQKNGRKRKNIDIKKILDLREKRLTLEQIAQQEGISLTTLYDRIRQAEGTKEHEEYKNQRLKNIDMKGILELRKKRLSLKQIAQQQGVSTGTLLNRINEAEGTPEYEEYKRITKSTKRKNIDIIRILELKKAGLTLEQIAQQEGTSIPGLCRRIKKAKGTPEYDEYKKLKLPQKKSDSKKNSSKKTSKKQNIRTIPNNKELLVFMLQNGATPEEITEIYANRGLEMNAREQLEQYIADIHKGRLKPTALERNMISYVQRLLNIKMEDIAELEGLVTNKSPIHRISSQTNIEELAQQYNIKSGKNFSRLELEFVLNRIKNAKENILVSPYIIPEGETLSSKIEEIYDSIELDRLQTIR